jgi:hypothetical protein
MNNGWTEGWMDGWTVILVSKLGGVFLFFPKQLVNCVGLVSNVQMPVSWTASSVRPYYSTFTDGSTTMLQQTNKQTNGCTWVDENPQAFLSFFLWGWLACCRTLNTPLQTLRVSVQWLPAASQAHQAGRQPASQPATGAKLEVHIQHPWLITGLLVGLAFDTHNW